MRYRSLGWIMMGAWLGAFPIAAHAADYLATAKASLKKGDLKSAQIDLRNAVRNDPQNAEAHYWLGRVAFELGDPVASEREAIAARDRGFDPHQAVPLLSQALLAQNKFDDVLEKLKPDGKDQLLDASILVARGYAQIGLKRPEDAQRSFAEAEQASPNAVEPLLADARLAVARADLAGAQAKIDRAIAAQPKSAEALLAKAQLLRLKNDVPGAIAVLDELIIDQPSVTQARLDRASLELAAGKNDAAKVDIDVVLKGTPGNVQAIYLQAVMEAQSRNYKAADADLERIAGYIGRIQRAFYLQAIVKEQLGQLEQAEESARKYLGRAPNDLAAYKVLARIQFAKHRPDQVVETLAKVAESGKGDAEAYDLLGRAYAATGRGPEAIQSFQKAETLAPNDVGVQTRLASVRMGMGDVDTAMGDLEHTLELAPKLPAVGEALFFAALATGDTTKAGDALAKIRAAQGQTEVVGNLEGLFKLAQIDFTGAKAAFSDLVQKYPDFTPAKINLARVDIMLGDKPAAEKILTDVLTRQPTAEPALTMMVSNDVQSNRLPDAIDLLEHAHRTDPGQTRITVSLGDLYIRSGAPQKALDLADAEKGSNASSTDILSLRAAAYLALGQKKDARSTYADILKQDGNVIGARRQLVALLVEAGDFESARNVITAGIAANPRNYQLYQDYVMIDLKSTGMDAALATADRLQSQDREFPGIKALKGDIYLAANRPADAVAAYTEANNAAPSSLLVTRLAGAMLRSGRADDASKLLLNWLGKHADDMVATEQLAEINIATAKLDDAAKYLEVLLKQKPHDPVALNNLAWVYQQQGNDAKAQALARQAYVLSPSPQTADTLGWILTTSGNAQSGVTLLRQASGDGTSDPRILYHYAVALKDTGDKDAAKKALETVVANQSEFKEKALAQKLLDDLSKGS
ncbi:MAG: PEP-CTERM system TPR-repeat protein PrsT [Rhodopila sp.]|nr:PEP-CTERM system TPR-repeat protein PrsT [Rhodopila sp.]